MNWMALTSPVSALSRQDENPVYQAGSWITSPQRFCHSRRFSWPPSCLFFIVFSLLSTGFVCYTIFWKCSCYIVSNFSLGIFLLIRNACDCPFLHFCPASVRCTPLDYRMPLARDPVKDAKRDEAVYPWRDRLTAAQLRLLHPSASFASEKICSTEAY